MVNNEALKEYTKITGKTVKYGVFAVSQENLDGKEIFDKDGNKANGVILAEISDYGFTSFELKIVGFTEEQKEAKLAMGAYVAVTDKATEYSYIQFGTPNAGEKYCYVSYNDIVGTEVVQ